MRNRYILILVVLISCNELKEPVLPSSELHKFEVSADVDPKIELSYSVNGIDSGEDYVGIQIYSHDSTSTSPEYFSRNILKYLPILTYQYKSKYSRRFIGLAIQDLTQLGKSLGNSIEINFELKIYNSLSGTNLLTGSFKINKNDIEGNTNVYWVASVDYLEGKNTYFFRELSNYKVDKRKSDYIIVNELDLSEETVNTYLQFYLTWEVYNKRKGYEYVDLDMYSYSNYDETFIQSESESSFEGNYVYTLNNNLDYYLGFNYYKLLDNSLAPSSEVKYKYIVYSSRSFFKRYVFEGSFNVQNYPKDSIIYKLRVFREGDIVKFEKY